MKKARLFILLLFYSAATRGQHALPDNFTIDDVAEVYASDSIKIYFDCGGTVSVKRCADYYRVGKIDPRYLSVTGLFHDYFLNGKMYLEASAKDGALEGPAKYYYSNGQLKETGQYTNGARTGKWTFYYPNGNLQKVYVYEGEFPLVLEAFNEDNKQTVKDGNGHFKTEFSRRNACVKFKTEGNLINGKRTGAWTFSNINAGQAISEEIYDNGVYIKSHAQARDYIEPPNTGLSVYYGNENLQLVVSDNTCAADHNVNVYKPFSLHTFIDGLQEQLNACPLSPENQWLIVGLTTGTKNNLLNLNVASTINDTTLENYIYNTIRKIKKWGPSYLNSKKTEADFFFTIFTDNHKIYIADYVAHKEF